MSAPSPSPSPSPGPRPARPSGTIAPEDLRSILRGGSEIALLDVREEGAFLEGHLFLARNLPLGRIASRVETLVPRRRVLVVTMDGGPDDGGRAADAARRLLELGYTNVLSLDGGLAAWRRAGGEVFSGAHVPSKAFGEFVALTYRTPAITPQALRDLVASGRDVRVLDARTFDEYRAMSIPAAISVPGEELVLRVGDIAPDPHTLVVVNCAGRTRSIIGAQSLINAGIANPVAALKDGTSGWQLAGLPLVNGAVARAPETSAAGRMAARKGAAAVARRFGVRALSRSHLARWQAEAAIRTLYLVDVRSPAEFASGHIAGSRNVPGGQLVQATDTHLGVANARVALVDDDGVRAAMTASWLIQMGWSDVGVVTDALDGPLVRQPSGTPAGAEGIDGVSPVALSALLRSSLAVVVLDVAPPAEFERGHVPGAYAVAGAAPEAVWSAVANFDAVVLTAPTPAAARAEALRLRTVAPAAPLQVLAGGTPTWIASGLPIEAGAGMRLPLAGPACAPAADRAALDRELRKYLSWEVGLVEQLRRSGEAPFRYFAR
ncbi:rhodanese-like domain-containing protein [Xanthobacter pseudotagetidis]|uniref:rhodanese-like domain-containing protein n=1 Tax=Xanthobacter pseudotagetidis TaxID=3119911 RepID=UPI0037290C08